MGISPSWSFFGGLCVLRRNKGKRRSGGVCDVNDGVLFWSVY
jgi:hypothetical protein